MKLKLVVASMSILGLVSCPVFAATETTTDTATATTTETATTPTTTASTTTTTTTTKHKHHHRMVKHHYKKGSERARVEGMEERREARGTAREREGGRVEAMEEAREGHRDYKAMAMPVEPVCTITQNAMMMTEMTQNLGRSLPDACNPGWFNRIQVSGGINVDIGKWGNRNANLMGENYQRLSLNDAYLNIGATVNDWAKAFASLSFGNPTINVNPGAYKIWGAAEYDAAYSNNINGNASNVIQLEQAYATLGNFDASPFFIQVGKQFQDFSRYEIHPITESLTQVMSEVLATSIKGGFIVNGFSGSIAVFDDPINKTGNSSKPTNYIGALGYDMPSDQLGFDLGGAYIYNIIGANGVAYNVVNFNADGGLTGDDSGVYVSRVSAYALYADVNSGPFTVGARFTQALQRFNVNDLPKHGIADLTGGTIAGEPLADATGAKPWTAGITAAYGFNMWEKDQNVYLGYQASREAAGLNLPKSRWLAGYGINIVNNWNVGAEWDHDIAYSRGNGGSSNNTNLVSLRSSVKFG